MSNLSAEKNNQALWDELAPVHLKSYPEVVMLRKGCEVLDERELSELGDVNDKTLLHLQCHIGTDTLAWSRRGAAVTGVDFSAKSINIARGLMVELNLKAEFVLSNVYDLPKVLDERFDIVYTSRGVLCWLRDLNEWARVITYFLKPGGVLYIMESHPYLNVFEALKPGKLSIAYPYFHQSEPSKWDDEEPDYSDREYFPKHPSYEWQWSISDVFCSLIQAGLRITSFNEIERTFDQQFPSMKAHKERWYILPQYPEFPLCFTLKAIKPMND